MPRPGCAVLSDGELRGDGAVGVGGELVPGGAVPVADVLRTACPTVWRRGRGVTGSPGVPGHRSHRRLGRSSSTHRG
ncbi:hypothetical protein ABZ353_32135, partial [Streptomyces niveus]|uniref:hypothetical protein n=1 Tax=Streptomyces niveus TaxID=193462 RepID=UPI0033FA46C6